MTTITLTTLLRSAPRVQEKHSDLSRHAKR